MHVSFFPLSLHLFALFFTLQLQKLAQPLTTLPLMRAYTAALHMSCQTERDWTGTLHRVVVRHRK